jgi:hypothetical protein
MREAWPPLTIVRGRGQFTNSAGSLPETERNPGQFGMRRIRPRTGAAPQRPARPVRPLSLIALVAHCRTPHADDLQRPRRRRPPKTLRMGLQHLVDEPAL